MQRPPAQPPVPADSSEFLVPYVHKLGKVAYSRCTRKRGESGRPISVQQTVGCMQGETGKNGLIEEAHEHGLAGTA